MFVITESGQVLGQETSIPLDEASEPLKNKGVEIYAIAVGGKVPEKNLQDIASRPQNIFTPASSVNDLSQRQPRIVNDWKKYLRGQ